MPGATHPCCSRRALTAILADRRPASPFHLFINPGPTATSIWGTPGLADEQLEQVAESASKRLSPGRFLEASAVANVILFQLSQGARGVFGQDWVVDNGSSLT